MYIYSTIGFCVSHFILQYTKIDMWMLYVV